MDVDVVNIGSVCPQCAVDWTLYYEEAYVPGSVVVTYVSVPVDDCEECEGYPLDASV
jgi:hypothetical protein